MGLELITDHIQRLDCTAVLVKCFWKLNPFSHCKLHRMFARFKKLVTVDSIVMFALSSLAMHFPNLDHSSRRWSYHLGSQLSDLKCYMLKMLSIFTPSAC